MPVSYYPVPKGYIVWRDTDGRYHAAKQPETVILSGANRTQVLQRLYTKLQIEEQKEETK